MARFQLVASSQAGSIRASSPEPSAAHQRYRSPSPSAAAAAAAPAVGVVQPVARLRSVSPMSRIMYRTSSPQRTHGGPPLHQVVATHQAAGAALSAVTAVAAASMTATASAAAAVATAASVIAQPAPRVATPRRLSGVRVQGARAGGVVPVQGAPQEAPQHSGSSTVLGAAAFAQHSGKEEAAFAPLEPGVEVEVGSHRFRIIDVLGSGSYSTVWCAKLLEGQTKAGSNGEPIEDQEVALKDVECRTHAALRQALFEVQLLLGLERKVLLHDDGPKRSALRLPRCMTYKVHPGGRGWSVRTAMTRLPGEQLDAWLGRTAKAAASGCSSSGGDGLPTGQTLAPWTSHLQRGCAMASQLICQLGPTLDYLSTMAWHRDVNSHNIMVAHEAGGRLCSTDTGMQASFWLCDLGLAVDSQSWSDRGAGPAEDVGGAWRVTDIGGDCRYWPPGAWMLHCYGADYLAERAEYCEQYRNRLDVHGLGITAIEVLCGAALAAYREDPAGGPNSAVWSQLMDAWQDYRDTVGTWWEYIYSVFSEGGDFGPVHNYFTQNAVPDQTIRMLERLHQALCECIGVSDAATGRLLRVLVELTHYASTMDLQEACALLEEGGALQDTDMLRQAPAVIKEEEEGCLEEEEQEDFCKPQPTAAADDGNLCACGASEKDMLSLLTAAFKDGRPAPRMLSFSDRGVDHNSDHPGLEKALCTPLVAAPPG